MSLSVVEIMEAMENGKFSAAVQALKEEDQRDPEVLAMLGQAYYSMGRFEEAYHTLSKLYYGDDVDVERMGVDRKAYHPLCKKIYKILSNLSIDNMTKHLPRQMDNTYPQSVESADEKYEECDEFQKFLEDCMEKTGQNMEEVTKLLNDEILSLLKSDERKKMAKAWFYKAELAFRRKDYLTASQLYSKAANAEVSKALYYGFAGHMLMRLQKTQPAYLGIASVFMNRAIALDGNNAKWHLNEAMILISLSQILGDKNEADQSMLKAAKEQIEAAEAVLRPDQASVKDHIIMIQNKLMQVMK
ncbi:MAG: tetratricopeptide repeat protein [Lachnospiraceae bacterium]|nr:tetratricopeptide repeat protein [Lachnospiraceae bacterium]